MTHRVLHVVPDLVPYGLENMVAGLVLSMDRTRFETGVVSLYAESQGGLEPALREGGSRVFHLDKRRGLDLRMYPRLLRVLREFRPHILHTHNYVLRYTYPVALASRVPAMVHTIHNVADREVDLAGRCLQAIAFRAGVAAVAIAGEVSASFRRVYGFPEAALIPNGIPVREYHKSATSKAEWRRSLGIGADELVLVSVARFSEQKDHATLLKAFHAGPAQRPQTRLLLAGDGELRPEVERLVEELGLRNKVTFLGRRTDIPDVLGAADVFVLASRWEGNPLSVMEAMAAGKPVVATTVGAIPELVRHGVDGMLVAPGEVEAMARALSAVCAEPGRRAEMGRAASERAAARFDLSAMVAAYTDLYDCVLSARWQKGTRVLAATT